MNFPDVTGTNLLRRKVNLPAELKGELNILFIAFQQWQQSEVDSWIPTARKLEQSFPGVQYYETPVIYKMNFLAQTFINEGMRMGIPNQTSREKTITLYLDKTSFRSSLDIKDEESITILLVDRVGNIIWRSNGLYTEEKGAELLSAMKEVITCAA